MDKFSEQRLIEKLAIQIANLSVAVAQAEVALEEAQATIIRVREEKDDTID